MPPQALLVIASSGSFAAISFLFGSPLIAAIIMIEAAALGGQRTRVMLIPGLIAAGIGSLVSTGVGSLTGLSSSDYSLAALELPAFDTPTLADFAWTIVLAPTIAIVVAKLIMPIGWATERRATTRPFVVLPIVGLAVAVCAWIFGQVTDKPPDAVLLSGQDALPGLVSGAGGWSLSALAALIALKGIAYALALGSFRGGPTFPAPFLGAAAGIMADHLPGLSTTPAIAICMAAATVAVLRLPLSAGVLVGLLTIKGGAGAAPLIVVAVVVAYMTMLVLTGAQIGPGGEAERSRPVAETAQLRA
jgi:hypothetical protein